MLAIANRAVCVDDVIDVVLDLEDDILTAVREMGLKDMTVTPVDFDITEMEGYDFIEEALDDIVEQLNVESRLIHLGQYYWDYMQGMFVIGFEVTGPED